MDQGGPAETGKPDPRSLGQPSPAGAARKRSVCSLPSGTCKAHRPGPSCRRQSRDRSRHSPMRIPVARMSKRAFAAKLSVRRNSCCKRPLSRFANSKKLVSYLGLHPSEESSGGRQRLGAISKQGNTMLRCLLVEAAQTASIYDPELRRDYQRLKCRRGNSGVANVAIARKLAVRLYGKLREAAQPNTAARMQGSPAVTVVGESLSCF